MEFIGGPGFKVDSKPSLPHPQPKPQLDPEVNDKREGVKEEEEEPPPPLPLKRRANSTDNYVGSRGIPPAVAHQHAPQKQVFTGSDKSKTKSPLNYY